jgi:hypothetical protein
MLCIKQWCKCWGVNGGRERHDLCPHGMYTLLLLSVNNKTDPLKPGKCVLKAIYSV